MCCPASVTFVLGVASLFNFSGFCVRIREVSAASEFLISVDLRFLSRAYSQNTKNAPKLQS